MEKNLQKRILSIDILRGIVMVLMALDHTRDYFHIYAFTDDPLNLATTTPILFFTRFITHYCAPIFVFLSGISIYLQSLRKTKKELSQFLMKRGLWLIFVEIVIMTFGWSFNPNYTEILLQVIWVIGVSMFILGLLIWLPYAAILSIGLLLVIGHNALDFYEASPSFNPNFWWDILHHGNFVTYKITQNHSVLLFYPIIPWCGLMIMGYCFGQIFTPKFAPIERQKLLNKIGIGLILTFIIVRFINIYGDPVPWDFQKNGLLTFFSFINVNKYPPSLMYMCITIGPGLLALSYLEKIENGFTKIMVIFGRTAFFYYILHLYLIHALAALNFYLLGHQLEGNPVWYFLVPGEGYHLAVVYAIWMLVILILFPLCKWYNRYKSSHREQWWLSYL